MRTRVCLAFLASMTVVTLICLGIGVEGRWGTTSVCAAEDDGGKSGGLPPLVIDMIAIGEEAARLDMMFDKIAETYDSDVSTSLKTLNAVLEPIMILVIGCIVLVLAMAVLLPYWKIGTVIHE